MNETVAIDASIVTFQDIVTMSHLRSLQGESVVHDTTPAPSLSGNKDFYPFQSRPPTLDLLQDRVKNDLIGLHRDSEDKTYGSINITKREKMALKELKNNKNLIIRAADKGGAVVIMNAQKYIKINMEMLSDTSTYQPLPYDPTKEYQTILKGLLERGVYMGVYDEKVAEKLFVPYPVVPLFHSLPKFHKELFPPPMRPIVAGIGSMGERLGSWVDQLLQPLVFNLPGFLWDTRDTITKVERFEWNTESG